ncbi:hypothetical protein CVT24_006515 [Panaeolus cyanescens]|uniref:Uncharacterized protein n=1 Tax=Panaeolus cyanescens TaxID=181874 RepID=A0A409WNH1_9AGAR|nr:hypothetical protein CVT24_006515 [Panaeolus cyanescens]
MTSRRVTIASYQQAIQTTSPTNSTYWTACVEATIGSDNVLDDGESECGCSSFDFPAPPPFRSPVIRRVKSTPWYSTPSWDNVCQTLQCDQQVPSTSVDAFEDTFDISEPKASTPRANRLMIPRLIKRASAISFRDLTNWSSSELRTEQQCSSQERNDAPKGLRLPHVIRKVASMTSESEGNLKNKGGIGYWRENGMEERPLAAFGIVMDESTKVPTELAPAFQLNTSTSKPQRKSLKLIQRREKECSFMDITPERGVIPMKSGAKSEGIRKFMAKASERILRWRFEGNRTKKENKNS